MQHEDVEKNIGLMMILIIVAISFGALVELVPLFFAKETNEPIAGLKPLSGLELTGRDIYIREGCSVCHSQQVRPLLAEVKRYGPYSRASESVYDRPFLWGSKRTGPDLQRIGGKYTDLWHRLHLINPRDVVANSIMPAYPWLITRAANENEDIQLKMRALQKLGHPYSNEEIEAAPELLNGLTDLDALIAYLQGLGVINATGEGP